jgi:uncharacterized membrane protein
MILFRPKEEIVQKSTRFERAFIRRVFDLATAAFGLVAALAWNDAIRELIQSYIPIGSALSARIIYAVIVTVLAVLVALQIGAIAARLNLDEDKKDHAQKK